MMAFVAVMLLVLIVGDAASTFLYHVPQHLWGKLHLRVHHDRSRSYWDHAVISSDPAVLLDGVLGAFPYIVIAFVLWPASPAGASVGLVLGQIHVWWRHTTELGWITPRWLFRVARVLQIVLPEDHDGHHRNPDVEFGDIFRFYDAPARAFIAHVRSENRRRRLVMRRLERFRTLKALRQGQQQPAQ
ncbi:MAG: sterol desaturase family protein [Candidatus Eremiobacteraeota bacterium]|nr:sterol desaturase family protein [Candidatus Eremiobacteraeota bacterium]